MDSASQTSRLYSRDKIENKTNSLRSVAAQASSSATSQQPSAVAFSERSTEQQVIQGSQLQSTQAPSVQQPSAAPSVFLKPALPSHVKQPNNPPKRKRKTLPSYSQQYEDSENSSEEFQVLKAARTKKTASQQSPKRQKQVSTNDNSTYEFKDLIDDPNAQIPVREALKHGRAAVKQVAYRFNCATSWAFKLEKDKRDLTDELETCKQKQIEIEREYIEFVRVSNAERQTMYFEHRLEMLISVGRRIKALIDKTGVEAPETANEMRNRFNTGLDGLMLQDVVAEEAADEFVDVDDADDGDFIDWEACV